LHCVEGADECNIMEIGVMSLVETVGLVESRSACLCCVVLCCGCAVWCSRINCTVLKLLMKVTLWRVGSCY